MSILHNPHYLSGIIDYHNGVWREHRSDSDQVVYEVGRQVAAYTGTRGNLPQELMNTVKDGAIPEGTFDKPR